MRPLYVKTYQDSKIDKKIKTLNNILSSCRLCPRRCGVNRLKDERGFCGAGKDVRISSKFAHFGEERCLVGRHGSGTIFFSYCNLKCIFCQNYEISHLAEGIDVSIDKLANFMIELQDGGCHNINLVTPTHYTPQVLTALKIAIGKGLNLPVVYNCGGYESEEVIELLDGVIDIYMPDTKFSSPEVSNRLSNAPDYFENLKNILKEMHNQVGDLQIIDGIARRGLLIRHLVMPEGLTGAREVMKFIATEISVNTYINIMAQYRPCGEAYKDPKINRPINQREYIDAFNITTSFGLTRFD